MAQSDAALAAKYLLVDFFGGILAFPVWWYGRGLAAAFRTFAGSARTANRFLGLGVWTKNLFVPMYGERQISGRLISFFMRFVNIIVRGIAFVVWMILAVLVFAAYLLVIPLSVFGIIYHGFGQAFL